MVNERDTQTQGASFVERLGELRDTWGEIAYVVLANVLRPVGKHWFVALVVFVLCFGYFVAQALVVGYTYVASASLLVTPPAYQSQAPGSEFMPQPLDVPSYAALLKDDGVLEQVCTRLHEEKPELWQRMKDNGVLVPEVITRKLFIATQVVEKTPQRVVYSQRIALRAECGKPEQAKHLLDTWIDVSLRAVQDFSRPGSEATLSFIKQEYDKAKVELEAREDKLSDQQAQWNIALLENLKTEKEEKLATLESTLLDVAADAAQAASELADVEAALATEDEKKTLRRSPSNDALAILGVKDETEAKAIPVFTDEVLNTVYTTLKTSESEISSEFQGLEARRETLATQIASLREELDALNRDYVEQQLAEARLQRDVDASLAYFDVLAKQREEMAAIEAHGQLEQASLITAANKPVLPTMPHNRILRWARIPFGFFLGIAAAVAMANVVYELHRGKERLSQLMGKAAEPSTDSPSE